MEETVEVLKNTFLKTETYGWNEIDNAMSMLEWIDDDQLCREVDVLLHIHLRGEPKCANGNHKAGKCVVPYPSGTCCVVPIITTAAYITQKYLGREPINDSDRYVLRYYLALSQAKLILG